LENIAYLRETLKIHKFSINSFSKYYLHNLTSNIHFSKTCNLFYIMLTVSPGWSSWIPKCATKQRERENLPFRMGFSRALSLSLSRFSLLSRFQCPLTTVFLFLFLVPRTQNQNSLCFSQHYVFQRGRVNNKESSARGTISGGIPIGWETQSGEKRETDKQKTENRVERRKNRELNKKRRKPKFTKMPRWNYVK